MKLLKYSSIVGLTLIFVTADMEGQTLFSSPDTSPDYSRYHYVEQCLGAGYRVNTKRRSSQDSIFTDTMTKEAIKKMNQNKEHFLRASRQKSAIDTINLCLKDFKPDTVNITNFVKMDRIVTILLVAHRDDDADRFAKRFLDSVKNESENNSDPKVRNTSLNEFKRGLGALMSTYGSLARPVRYDVSKDYYRRYLAARSKDSAYYTIDAAIEMRALAKHLDDSVTKEEAGHLAIRLNDSIPEGERMKMPGANLRLNSLAGIMVQVTQNEALDSIAVSSVAYHLWFYNTIRRRIYGGEIATREKAQPPKLPELSGAFYYTANDMSADTLNKGPGTYTHKGALPKDVFPVKNRIHYLRAFPSICHVQTQTRGVDNGMGGYNCFFYANTIRQFKRDYPEVEIIGLSSTYGTVGELGPLKPAEEADTLAKYFLGFHRLPMHLVVENTEFFNLAAPDNRRVDIVTPNSEALGQSVLDMRHLIRITDKEGYMLDVPRVGDEWFKRFYEILRDRPTPK